MVQAVADETAPVKKRKVSTKFCANILKVLVGDEKAKAAFSSISMGAIKNFSMPKTLSASNINKSHSLSEIGDMFSNKLADFKDKMKEQSKQIQKRKEDGKSGIDAYIAEDSNESDDSDDPFDEGGDNGKSLMAAVDPSKLIDLELINLLRYCHEL